MANQERQVHLFRYYVDSFTFSEASRASSVMASRTIWRASSLLE